MLRALAGIVAKQHRATRQQLRIRPAGFQLLLQLIERGHQLVALFDTESIARQLAVQEIPAALLRILDRQPAVMQQHFVGVLLHRKLRAAHQQQRIVADLLAADAREGREQLRQNPVGLRVTTVLQARARGRIDQAVAMLKRIGTPALHLIIIQFAAHLFQHRQGLQLRLPPGRNRIAVVIVGTYQPHQLTIEALHKAVLNLRWRLAEVLLRQ